MLSPSERAALLSLARASVSAAASRRDAALPPVAHDALKKPAGVFTTLHESGGDLRGCIGVPEAKLPLWDAVWRTAAEAAMEDPRFDPVVPDEVLGLRIEISVLSPLRPATHREVRIGEHGVVVARGPRRALLLPQVASERSWSVETFLDATCDKAGLDRGAWQRGEATIAIFTAEVFGE